MGNNQQPSNAKPNESNEDSNSQKNTPPSTNTHPQVSASAASSGAADGRFSKSLELAGSDSLKPLIGRVPPNNRLDNKHLPPIALASSLKETPRLPQDSQGTQKLENLEQMYANLMLKLTEMDGENKSTPVRFSYTFNYISTRQFVNDKSLNLKSKEFIIIMYLLYFIQYIHNTRRLKANCAGQPLSTKASW